MTLAAQPEAVAPEETVTFTLALSNTSDAPINSVLLSATLPGELGWVSQPGWTYDEPTRRVNAEVGPIEPGARTASGLQLRANRPLIPFGQSKRTTLAAEARNNDPTNPQPLANASASVTITLPSTPSLAMSLTAWPGSVPPGKPVTFTLTLTNIGNTPINALVLSATVSPKGLHWMPDQPGWVYDASSKHLTAEVGELAPDEVMTLPLRFHTSGPLERPATLVIDALYEDVTVDSASASAWIRHPKRIVDATLEKQVEPWLVWPRDVVTYTLAAHNPGNRILKRHTGGSSAA